MLRPAGSAWSRWCRDFGGLDVLVHSAGGPVPGGFYAVTDESWMDAFAVHVHSIFWMSRAAAPLYGETGRGRDHSAWDQPRDCAGVWAHSLMGW